MGRTWVERGFARSTCLSPARHDAHMPYLPPSHRNTVTVSPYRVRPAPFTSNEQQFQLAAALEELAQAVRAGKATGGQLKLWPRGFSAATVTARGNPKAILIGIEVEEPPPACAAAAELFTRD